MIIQRDESSELRPDQVRAMAQGLYWLALIEGVTERERTLLQDFLREGGVDLDPEALSGIPFSLEGLLASLDTLFLRKTFLRTCILMAKADGTVSSQEMGELRRLAQAMGIDEPLDSLMADVEQKSIEI
jgi:uncharacterized membrane protein YebE (DUF533 family)